MRARFWIGLIVCAELALVGGMALQREWILRHGATLVLRTAPMDPDDPMRGAYVQLKYELNAVQRAHWAEDLRAIITAMKAYDYRWLSRQKDRVVYASLNVDPTGEVTLNQLSLAKPDRGVFLRGRIVYVSGDSIQVRYGIEAYFANKTAAQKIDRERLGERRTVPLDVELAVSPDGIAVIRRTLWESLGLTVRPRRAAAPTHSPGAMAQPRIERPALSGLDVELKNYSSNPVGVVVRPHGHSFRIETVEWNGGKRYAWVHADDPVPNATAEEVRVLKPGESYRETLDADDPYWSLKPLDAGTGSAEVQTLRQVSLDWSNSFRLEYAPGILSVATPGDVETPTRPVRSNRWSPSQGVD